MYVHTTRNIIFTLVVDNISIFYQTINNLTHLRHTIISLYSTTFDATESLY